MKFSREASSAARRSSTITTYSGRHIDLLNPDPSQICIDDVAAHLAKTNRFTGATFRDYKVAEHLLLGVDYCTPEARFRWFTHDFSETYLGDVSGPFKRTVAMELYCEVEEGWEMAIAVRFGYPFKPNPNPLSASNRAAKEVKAIDGRMLVTEQRDLMGRRPLSTDAHKPFAMHIAPVAMSSEHLQERFLATFYDLASKTEGAIR